MAKRRKSYRRDNGILHSTKLMFTSKARRSAMLFGMALAPLVMRYSKVGLDASKWIVAQAEKLRGQ